MYYWNVERVDDSACEQQRLSRTLQDGEESGSWSPEGFDVEAAVGSEHRGTFKACKLTVVTNSRTLAAFPSQESFQEPRNVYLETSNIRNRFKTR